MPCTSRRGWPRSEQPAYRDEVCQTKNRFTAGGPGGGKSKMTQPPRTATLSTMESTAYPTIRIDHNGRGDWQVELLDEDPTRPLPRPVRCRTLEEARRVAYRQATRQQPCELVICDAYHRVAHHEVVGRQ
jgi:hypothetical protein